MKKFKTFLTILILLLLVGGGFYFGWIQIRLGENDYGVVFTKMKGYDPEVMVPGKFIWRWENLLPTNMKLHVLHLEPRQTLVSQKGQLPSGELFSKVLDSAPSFEYDLSFRVIYRLRPEALPALVESGSLVPGDLEGWYGRFEDSLAVQVLSFIQTETGDGEAFGATGLDTALLESSLAEALKGAFPDVEVVSVLPVKVVIPDLQVYRKAREEYLGLMTARRDINETAMREAAARTMNQSANLQLLEEYGALLTKYPVLLEYLDKNPRFSEDLLDSVRQQ